MPLLKGILCCEL